MNFPEVYSATGMMELIQKIGFLPLLDSGIEGFSAEDIVAEDCGYVRLPEGGWDWPLWKWKGEIVQEMPCMYGKFFNKKAGFISQEWWPDFCNYRRSKYPRPDEESIEGAILSTLQSTGSLITRELRAACGFTGKGMRSKFDGYLTRLEMATYIVTEDAEKIHGLRLISERFLPQHMDAFDQSIARSLSRTAVVRITLTEPPTGKRKQYDKEGVEMKYGRME